MKLFDLTGRVILLTGAAGHIGSAISNAILSSGAHLIATGRQESSLVRLKNSLTPDFRERCHIVACDATNIDTPGYLKSLIEPLFGRLDGIVNNAYAGKLTGTVDCIEPEDFYAAYTNNVTAPFLLIKCFLPLLEITAKKNDSTTSIVNVASMYGTVSPDPSIYGDTGKNNPIHYGASKAGMIQMSRYLACHFGRIGIRFNSISPGPFPKIEFESENKEFYSSLERKVPMGRVGKVQEVAGPVVFLLSEAASYVNGVNLPIDGGWTAW
jgi:NAD(P)-dependent dehydrogenase (short-subunit alcohol dehydrogenase family)